MKRTERDSNVIQCFPIDVNTQRLNTGDSTTTYGYEVIHLVEDSDLTFTFSDGSTFALSYPAHMDFAIGEKLTEIEVVSGSILIS